MKAYRYNAKQRTDRKFNNCGREKNPNAIQFFATNMAYAERYKFITDENGEVSYECELHIKNITANLFDMNANYSTLQTYKTYIGSQIGAQLKDYTRFMNKAKTKKESKMWKCQIEQLLEREGELESMLIATEFQVLSDFELQNMLVAELKALGFQGYRTKNEIALI